MIQYEVGKPFPHPNRSPGADYTRADFSAGFFDVLCFISYPLAEEIKNWRTGKLRYGLYTNSAIPFFIIDFPEAQWNLDVNINIHKILKPEQMDAWLNAEGNVINLFLVNTHTHILEAMRMISVHTEVAEKVKDILEEQSGAYTDASSVDNKILSIQETIPTTDMMRRCKMFNL